MKLGAIWLAAVALLLSAVAANGQTLSGGGGCGIGSASVVGCSVTFTNPNVICGTSPHFPACSSATALGVGAQLAGHRLVGQFMLRLSLLAAATVGVVPQ